MAISNSFTDIINTTQLQISEIVLKISEIHLQISVVHYLGTVEGSSSYFGELQISVIRITDICNSIMDILKYLRISVKELQISVKELEISVIPE